MSVTDWFRKLFAGPSHVDADGDADLERMAAGQTVNEPYAAMEAAEAAQAEVASEETPPDPE